MAILVINTFAKPQDAGSVQSISGRIGDLVNQARTSRTPIAHLHEKRSKSGSEFRIPIGRYEPVFQAMDLRDGVPDELIDFIVGSPSKTIKLVGAASWEQIKRLSGLIHVAGYSAQIEPSAFVETYDQP